MTYLNVEIKARCSNPQSIRDYLTGRQARFVGTDQQTDTYFKVSGGRLKLREGNIENNLIYYERDDEAGPKGSRFRLVRVEDGQGLRELLSSALGIQTIVKKTREIWYIENVKFHIDEVPGLGSFMEIEAGNMPGNFSRELLKSQCDFYMEECNIMPDQLVSVSYSDMLLEKLT